MATTTLLQIPETAFTQAQADQVINDGFSVLERASNDILEVSLASGNVTLTTNQQNRYNTFKLTGASGSRDFTLLDTVNLTTQAKRVVSITSDITNAGDVAIKIQNGAGTVLTLTPGSSVTIHVVGTIGIVLSSYGVSSTSPSLTYDVSVFTSGQPSASTEVYRLPVTQNLSFAADFSGSRGSANVSATADFTFTVKKNGSTVGSIIFTSAGNVTFSTSGSLPVLLAPGDVLTVETQGSSDATLSNPGITLFGAKV